MKRIAFAMAAGVLLAANAANAVVERYDCAKVKGETDIVQIDRDTKEFSFSEGRSGGLGRRPICAWFDKIARDTLKEVTPRCTVTFADDAVVADYVELDGPKPFDAMIGLDTDALTLTSIFRGGVDVAIVETVKCKRL